MRKDVQLTDKQFDGLDVSTRRALMLQLMFVDTPKYRYAIGACGEYWTIVRYDRQESMGYEWSKDYKPEVFDKWI